MTLTRPADGVFETCSSLLSANDASRTDLQTRSRTGISLCRQALGRLHRGDLDAAAEKMSESLELAMNAPGTYGPGGPSNSSGTDALQLEHARLTGGWAEAYVCAACFGGWLRTGVLSAPTPALLVSGNPNAASPLFSPVRVIPNLQEAPPTPTGCVAPLPRDRPRWRTRVYPRG